MKGGGFGDALWNLGVNFDVCSLRNGRDEGLVKSCRLGRFFVESDVDGVGIFD
jgi:hypothetical protein